MKAFEAMATNFAQALADARWEDAHSLLDQELQKRFSAQRLAETFQAMYSSYAEGPVTSVHFDPQFSMETWPAKIPGDVGWAYVSLHGNGFVEAVTVVVASSSGHLAIRDIEWGRP